MGEAKHKLKGTRSLDEINTEYSILCGQLGNFTFRKDVLDKEIGRIKVRLEEVDLEAGSAKHQEQAKRAEEKAASEPVSNFTTAPTEDAIAGEATT